MTNWYGSSTEVVIEAARERGVTVEHPSPADRNIAFLSHGSARHLVYRSSTDLQSHPGFKALLHKKVTADWLQAGGFPVPADIITDVLETAVTFLAEQGTVVVKPLADTGGNGVTPDITTPAQLAGAMTRAQAVNQAHEQGDAVVIQEHLHGRDYRILVINYEHVFVAERVPAHVVGDGQHTIQELVDQRNAGVATTHHIQLREQATELLAGQQLMVDSVPEPDQRVQLALVANTHSGGTIHDIPEAATATLTKQAIAVAQYVTAPILGIDCISPDIMHDFGKIIELNPTPDLRYFPDRALTQRVGRCVVDMLFPDTVV